MRNVSNGVSRPLLPALVALCQVLIAACGGPGGSGDGGGSPPDAAEILAPDATGDGPGEEDLAGQDLPGELPLTDAADATGDAGEVRGHWIQLYSPLSGDHVLKSVWGFGDGSAFAVGEGGTVVAREPGGLFAVDWQEQDFDILNGVWGSAPDNLWAVGMYGVIVRSDGDGWSVPNFCMDDDDCALPDPCFTGTCLEHACQYALSGLPGCCGQPVFQTGFDAAGDQTLFAVEQIYPGTGATWQVAALSDPISGAPRAVSPPSALYFGVPDVPCPGDPGKACPTFDTGTMVGATATSPVIGIPGNASEPLLSFQVLLDVESNPFTDLFEVYVVEGPSETLVWDKSAVGGSTGKQFVPVKVDLSDWAGSNVMIRFRFDSVDATANGSEGVYVDDVSVASDCVFPAEHEEFGTLWSVWGSGPDDVFAVGSEGAVAHFDGARWSRQAGGKVYDLKGIGGIGPDDVVMVGYEGLVLHAKGNSGWQEEESPLAGSFRRVWG
ncbi:MAG: hypothetical protein FJ098_11270, partial [Deltaproteobacteria bacterium]|nr:hypothetical protein [Deltaproteobacteria bacterium]